MQKLINLIKTLLNWVYFPFLLDGAKAKINKMRQGIQSPRDAVAVAFSFKYGLPIRGLNVNIVPAQIPDEIIQLVEKVQVVQPKVFLEIGTATGGSLFLWTQFLSDDAMIISIDLPFGKYGAGYLSVKGQFYKSFARNEQDIRLLIGDSHTQIMHEELEKVLNGNLIDFMFIDGDHSYEGVRADFLDYKKYVKDGGWIAFHDIYENVTDSSFGTYKFWEEIKSDFEYEEYIVKDRPKNGSGIGVIKM